MSQFPQPFCFPKEMVEKLDSIASISPNYGLTFFSAFSSSASHGTPSIHYNLLIILAVLKHRYSLGFTSFFLLVFFLISLPLSSKGSSVSFLCLFKVGAPQGFILCPPVLFFFFSTLLLFLKFHFYFSLIIPYWFCHTSP